MKRSLILLVLFLSFATISKGQQVLTLDSAIRITLKNSYSILIAKNEKEAAKVNNTMGNAGKLPTLSLNAADNFSYNNVYQELSSGANIQSSGAQSNAFTAGAALNWTLFDGGKMFVTKNKLNQIEALGLIQFRSTVLQTEYNVIVAYYNVVKQKQQLSSFNEVIALNRERVKILERSFNSGLAPKTDYLQAQIDLNVNRESALAQEAVIMVAKHSLNQILCRDPEIQFEVSDSIPNDYTLNKKALVKVLMNSNTDIMASGKAVDITKLLMDEQRRLLYPRFGLTAAYNFLRTDNNASTVLLNRNFGPQIGGALTIPIYNAGNTRRQIKLAGLQVKSAEYNLENVKIGVNTELQDAITAYQIQEELLAIEKETKSLAKENLFISMERLRLGQTTSLEVRQAQESYEASLTRFTNLSYNLKVAETRLKQLLAQL